MATIDTSSTTVGIADSDLYGMSDEDIDTTLAKLQAMGVTQIRVFVPWAYIQPLQDVYDWDKIDAVVDAAADRGMAVLAAVTSTPAWATDYVAPNAAPRSADDFADFVTELATRYGAKANGGEAKVEGYEIWNEPNGAVGWYPTPDPAAYTQLLKAAYTAIKKVDDDTLVIAAGLGAGYTAAPVTINPEDFLAGMYDAGAKGYFDAVAYHPYQYKMMFSEGAGTPITPYTQLLRLREVMDDNGDSTKLIWATEYGQPAAASGEADQAAFISDFLNTWSAMSGVGPMFIYTTRDRETGSTETEDTFGLFQTDWTPKEAADVVTAWIAAHPIPDTPTDPTWLQFLKQVVTAVANAIADVVHAGVQIVTGIVKAVVTVIDWAVTAVVKTVSWAVDTAVAAVKCVANAIRTVIDNLFGRSSAAPVSAAIQEAGLVSAVARTDAVASAADPDPAQQIASAAARTTEDASPSAAGDGTDTGATSGATADVAAPIAEPAAPTVDAVAPVAEPAEPVVDAVVPAVAPVVDPAEPVAVVESTETLPAAEPVAADPVAADPETEDPATPEAATSGTESPSALSGGEPSSATDPGADANAGAASPSQPSAGDSSGKKKPWTWGKRADGAHSHGKKRAGAAAPTASGPAAASATQ